MRIDNNLTQKQVSEIVKMPLRTYIRYENDEKYVGTLKYEKMIDKRPFFILSLFVMK